MQPKKLVAVAALLGCLPITSCKTGQAISHKDDFKQAYIYGFPMIAAYKAMHEFNIDKRNEQYKGPFNTIVSDARVFTPKDTAIVTPNSDTPYSMLQADLRAEPMVVCTAYRRERPLLLRAVHRHVHV